MKSYSTARNLLTVFIAMSLCLLGCTTQFNASGSGSATSVNGSAEQTSELTGSDIDQNEFENAIKKIDGGAAKEVSEGWTYLVKNRNNEQVFNEIESRGGIPTPSSNLPSLYQMLDINEKDAGVWLKQYFNDALEIDLSQPIDETNDFVSATNITAFGNLIENGMGNQEDPDTYINGMWDYHTENGGIYLNPSYMFNSKEGKPSDQIVAERLTEVAYSLGLGTIGEVNPSINASINSSSYNSDKSLWFASGEIRGIKYIIFYEYGYSSTYDVSTTDIQVILSNYFDSGCLANINQTYSKEGRFGDLWEVMFPDQGPTDNSGHSTQGWSYNPSIDKDELIVDTNEKQVWKVHATSSTIHFQGTYSGTGNFIVKVLDDNQELYELACNEIGDYVIDRDVEVTAGNNYYIQIESNNGSWNMTWTGTGGNDS